MAGETECADVIVGDGELLDGESSADGEGDAADGIDGVKSEYGAGVVAGPERVRDGVECECSDRLGVRRDGRYRPIHGGGLVQHVT